MGLITINEAYEGESIEAKMRRITTSNEPIEEGAPEIFTDRKDGVNPAYDIRTDRWEIAQEAQDTINRSKAAQRQSMPTKEEPQQNEVETPVTE